MCVCVLMFSSVLIIVETPTLEFWHKKTSVQILFRTRMSRQTCVFVRWDHENRLIKKDPWAPCSAAPMVPRQCHTAAASMCRRPWWRNCCEPGTAAGALQLLGYFGVLWTHRCQNSQKNLMGDHWALVLRLPAHRKWTPATSERT